MRPPRLVVALDVPDADRARAVAHLLHGYADVLKVGLELFAAAGPELVRELIAEGWDVFLDLKVHDIPATAAGAVRGAVELGVELLTLHTSGGSRMLEAAVAARSKSALPRLLGVTILTSLADEDLSELGWTPPAVTIVNRLCGIARTAGLDGVVASPREVATIKAALGDDFLVVTPGIRLPGAANDDQARTASPAAAVAAGADYLVVGRPILKARDPVAAAETIRAAMGGV